MTTNLSSPVSKSTSGTLGTGILLIVLGVVALFLPRISTLVAATWIALILISAGAAKLVYAFQTRDESGFIWKLLLSVLYIATGIMLLVSPLTSVVTLTLLLASFLFTEGVFELILAFRLRPKANWTWVLGDGMITLLLGAMIWFQWPFNAPWVLGTLVGASVLFTGVSRVMLAVNRHPIQPSSDQPATV